ncbi:MAG: DHA2 family efflux MFS transporter permease subunit, partial [Anaerolineales bacterium]|nr:DHA2 family efflux MFS transporter permease subunit [Anaerolineales bacterium]
MQEDLVDYSRKWYILAAVGMGVLLSTIDGSIVNVSLPTLSRTFDAEFALVQWVVLAYLVTLTTLILSVGRLGDLIGKKRPYTAGFVIFTLGSVLCGMAPSIYWLIGSRVIQGFGAAMMVALGTAIITEAFPGSERGKALGISGSIVSTGIVIGPVLGGLLIETFSWRWIFFVNLPVGILGILMVLRFVPASRPKWSGRFDFLGAITLFISLISLLFALTVGQEQGFTERLVLVLFLISIVFLVLFLLIEQKIEHPMVDLTMFENRKFSVGLISGFLTFVAIAGTIILMPFYLENVLGYGTRTVGFFLAIVPISMGFTAPIAGSLSDRMGTRPITILGLAVLIVGYLSLTTLETSTS